MYMYRKQIHPKQHITNVGSCRTTAVTKVRNHNFILLILIPFGGDKQVEPIAATGARHNCFCDELMATCFNLTDSRYLG